MSTKSLILPLTSHLALTGIIARAAEILEAGGLVVAPTETTYGLLVRADDPECLQKMIEAKGRPANMATAIFVKDRSHLELLAKTGEYGEILVDKFLPGPLTLVLDNRSDLPEPVVVKGKIGVRWSSHPLIEKLVKELTFPITATSANVSGKPGESDPGKIIEAFEERVALIIDAGPSGSDVSTVIDCSGEVPSLLREGAIARQEIEDALGVRIV